jgi:hypothetical protein
MAAMPATWKEEERGPTNSRQAQEKLTRNVLKNKIKTKGMRAHGSSDRELA